MKNILDIGEILIASLLIVTILLQKQSGGVSSLFGGSGEEYHTKRGFEKFLFWGTIALVAIFTLLALTRIVFYK